MVAAPVRAEMEGVETLRLHLFVDTGSGPDWSEAKGWSAGSGQV